MLNSGVLEVAVGLAVVFILVSTVCTSVREALETLLKTRAAYLEYAIRELLDDRAGDGLARRFFQHPLINGLFRDAYEPRPLEPSLFARGGDMPSYIPARSFATALIDLVARGGAQGAVSPQLMSAASLRESVAQLDNPYIQRALLSAMDAAQGDLDVVREHLEAWFDTAMDRVSGWYKRSTQKIIFGIALIVAGALNVDAIAIAEALYRDQALRAAAVASAAAVHTDQSASAALQLLDTLHLPIGWHGSLDAWFAKLSSPQFSLWSDLITPALGLLLTAFAATLGAPFWFDVLNKVMVIRATVKPHEKSPEEGSEDRRDMRNPAAKPAAQVIQIISSEGAKSAGAAASTNHDLDGCDVGGEHVTPDEALPPSIGGVH